MKVKISAHDPTTGTSPCWGIDTTLEAESEEEALDLWVEYNRDYLEEKAQELECDIYQLGQTQTPPRGGVGEEEMFRNCVLCGAKVLVDEVPDDYIYCDHCAGGIKE